MMDHWLDRVIAMPLPFTTWIETFHGYVGTHLVELTCSSMFASAVALPLFASPTLGAQGLFEFTLGIFGSSTLAFGWLLRIELQENAPLGLVLNISIALITLVTLKPSAKDSAPYMPLSAAIGIMVIVYVVPWARESFPAPSSQTLRDYVRAGHITPASGSDGASVDSDSTHSRGFSSWMLNQFTRLDPEPMDVEYTGYIGRYYVSDLPEVMDTLSVSESESELNPGSSTTSQDSTNRPPI